MCATAKLFGAQVLFIAEPALPGAGFMGKCTAATGILPCWWPANDEVLQAFLWNIA